MSHSFCGGVRLKPASMRLSRLEERRWKMVQRTKELCARRNEALEALERVHGAHACCGESWKLLFAERIRDNLTYSFNVVSAPKHPKNLGIGNAFIGLETRFVNACKRQGKFDRALIAMIEIQLQSHLKQFVGVTHVKINGRSYLFQGAARFPSFVETKNIGLPDAWNDSPIKDFELSNDESD